MSWAPAKGGLKRDSAINTNRNIKQKIKTTQINEDFISIQAFLKELKNFSIMI